ncbi:MAG: hypothetical protein J6Z79_04215 [Clostridia bacterium]|nr:hypothetical protein [Clostridia bacterium]
MAARQFQIYRRGAARSSRVGDGKTGSKEEETNLLDRAVTEMFSKRYCAAHPAGDASIAPTNKYVARINHNTLRVHVSLLWLIGGGILLLLLLKFYDKIDDSRWKDDRI